MVGQLQPRERLRTFRWCQELTSFKATRLQPGGLISPEHFTEHIYMHRNILIVTQVISHSDDVAMQSEVYPHLNENKAIFSIRNNHI